MPAAAAAVVGNLLGAGAVAVVAWAVGRWATRPSVAHAGWLLVLAKLVVPPLVVLPLLPAWEPSGGWVWAVAGVWAVGTVVSLVLAVGRARRFGKLLRFAGDAPAELRAEAAELSALVGLRTPPVVRVLAAPVAPLVWGAWRPTVYLPAGLLVRLTADQRRPVLLHELAHVRRGDPLVRWVECLLLAAAWWCPLAWLARRELRRHEEAACDAAVAAALPGSGYAYAAAVLEAADFLAATPAAAAGCVGDARGLRQRLEAVLDAAPPRPLPGWALAGLAAVAAAALLVGPGPRPPAPVADTPLSPAPAPCPGTAAAPCRAHHLPADEPGRYRPEPTRLYAGGRVAAAAAAGGRLAAAAGDGVRVVELAGGREPLTLAAGVGTVRAVALSPDGRRLVAAGTLGAALLDVATGERTPLPGHDGWVTAAAVSPDGRTAATGGYDRTVRLWDAATGEPRATWGGHAGGVTTLAFTPDGKTLATGGADHEVRLWDAATGGVVHTWADHAAAVRAVAFAPDGKTLATAAEDGAVRLWRTADGRPAGPAAELPDDPPTALGYAADGRTLFAGTAGGRLLALHPANGQVRGVVGEAHAAGVTAVLPAAGGRLLTASLDGTVAAWVPGRLDLAGTALAVGGPVAAVALSPDGRTLAAGGAGGVIRLWDAATGAERGTLAGHAGGVTALAFAAGGVLVSAGADERLRVWCPGSGRQLRAVPQAAADLRLAVSADGTLVAVASPGRPEVVVWHLDQAKPVVRLDGPWLTVSALAFAPAGDTLAVGHPCGTVRLWEVATGSEIAKWQAGGPVGTVAFEPDGRTVAVGVAAAPPAAEVRFWDTRAGTERADRPPLRLPAPASGLVFAGDQIVTAGRDGDLRLWDASTGAAAGRVRAHAGEAAGLALTPDRTAVFSAGDSSVKQWPLAALAHAREGRP